MGDLDKEGDGKILTKDLKTKIQEMNPYGNVDMLLKVIDDVDLDNDGTIDYEEFLHALHPDFQETPNWFWTDNKYKPKRKGSDNDDGREQKEADALAADEDEALDHFNSLDPTPADQQELPSKRSVQGRDSVTGKELHIV